MLEDESGRIRLVGQPVLTANLVTGVILGALGAETANGDFEVVDICYAGMAPYAHISHLEGASPFFVLTADPLLTMIRRNTRRRMGCSCFRPQHWLGILL